MSQSSPALLIAWTTLPDALVATAVAREAVERGLVVCAQVDGPTTSFYRWEGQVEQSVEVRVWCKFLPGKQAELEAWLTARHPYQIPQWIVVSAEAVAGKYLSWAREVS